MPKERYGWAHQRKRIEWGPKVERGEVDCWRCGKPIQPGQAWDLGHDDRDVTLYRGPEHANGCNRAAAGRKSGALRRARIRPMTSREW